MGRHEVQLRRGPGRGRGRGQGRGRGRDLRFIYTSHFVGEREVGHAPDNARRVEVVHRDIQDQEQVVMSHGSPTRETGWRHYGHPRDIQDIGRNSRKDTVEEQDTDIRFSERSLKYRHSDRNSRSCSHEQNGLPGVRVSRSRKRHPSSDDSKGSGIFRDPHGSRSSDGLRRMKYKQNIDERVDHSNNTGYHKPHELFRRDLSPAELGSKKKRKLKKRNENGNIDDRMKECNDSRVNHDMTTVTLGENTGMAKPVDSEEKLKSSSTTEKEDLASLILRTVCVDFPGKVDLASLRKALHQKRYINFSNSQTLYGFLKHYDNVFKIEGNTDREEGMIEDGEVEDTFAEDKFYVTGHPNLLLCLQHSKRVGSCKQDCGSLHVCKYFMLNKCDMQEQGKKCIFGHDMYTEHNKEVMRKSLLQTFKTEIEIDVLRFLRYRNSTTVPGICNYYNKPMGCNKAECGFLHVCEAFLHGTCSTSYRCNHSHDVGANQPLHCLRRIGINPTNDEEKELVVKTLKAIAINKNHSVNQGRNAQASTDIHQLSTGGYNKDMAKNK
ncbi:uncharacterized protein LOC124133113 [Haliotis rufescens]|uniref:uncharacterized protein LOC124133113 n=1 Tax=Haliotis rufescens TaxID=6454 RepID=UPI00201E7708|nr:uncharacterized protein LOC124133113 [Haliotis rufescens]